jgi:hypothetical protein
MAFNMARQWHNAPYRHKSLREVVAKLARSDAEFASFVTEATTRWQAPSDEKGSLELRILAALLNSQNYPPEQGGNFVCPPELAREIEAFENANLPARQIFQIPEWCRRVLNSGASLSDAAAEALSATVDTIDAETGLDEEFKARARVAVASTLLTRGSAWLDAHAAVRERSWMIIHTALSGVPTTMEQLRAARLERAGMLEFVAHAMFKWWIEAGVPEAQAAVVRIVTSGDKPAVAIFFIWLTRAE